jgi:hypothetical protein
MTLLHQMAANLLWIVWRGIGGGYKSRYRQTIWEQFENTVRASAYTNNLGKFINSLCSKLDVQLGSKADEAKEAEIILNSGNDKALLKLFRDETTLIVLMVRVRNQERREAWEAAQTEEEITPMDLFTVKETEE